MRLIITDVSSEELTVEDGVCIVEHDSKIQNCKGCFGCWVKCPGECALNDAYNDMGERLSKCSELTIISKCTYGGFSPFVKNVLDRSISYMHPNFVIRKGKMHHRRRYDNKITLTVYFYGDIITEWEKEIARKLVMANALNFDSQVSGVNFLDSVDELGGMLL